MSARLGLSCGDRAAKSTGVQIVFVAHEQDLSRLRQFGRKTRLTGQ